MTASTEKMSATLPVDIVAKVAGTWSLSYRGTNCAIEVIDVQRRARDAATAAAVAEDAVRRARLDVLVAGGRFPG